MELQSNVRLKLVLADDHQDVRDEIEQILRVNFDVIAVAGDGVELVERASALRPDLVVTDIRMPRLNGIEAAKKLLEDGCCRAAVALTTFNEDSLLQTALQAGFRGFVDKIEAGEHLVAAICEVSRGGLYLSSRTHR